MKKALAYKSLNEVVPIFEKIKGNKKTKKYLQFWHELNHTRESKLLKERILSLCSYIFITCMYVLCLLFQNKKQFLVRNDTKGILEKRLLIKI